MVLPIGALNKLKIASLDISKAYLQAAYLQSDIYMRQPPGFILKPAYGLFGSDLLWQTTVEPWMIDTYGLDIVPGLPKLFVYRGEQGPPRLHIAKVVDDFLLAGAPSEISNFLRRHIACL